MPMSITSADVQTVAKPNEITGTRSTVQVVSVESRLRKLETQVEWLTARLRPFSLRVNSYTPTSKLIELWFTTNRYGHAYTLYLEAAGTSSSYEAIRQALHRMKLQGKLIHKGHGVYERLGDE